MLSTQVSRSHALSTHVVRVTAALLAAIVVAGASVLTAPAAQAAPLTQDGIIFETHAGGTATVTGYSTPGTTVSVPGTITDTTSTTYTVTAIGDSAFDGAPITTVTIPDSVTTIGNRAFFYSALASVTIPDSVTTIGDWAFYRTHLTTITIPDSVITIGASAFQETQITSATIPDSVTTISAQAFAHNWSLTSITIPASVTTIGSMAFAFTGLTSVTIPGSVATIGIGAFEGTELTSVTIPDSVTTIGQQAFQDSGLTSVTIGNSVTTIGAVAFSGTSLTTVIIPPSVTGIGWGAFGPALTSAVFVGAPPASFTPNGTNGTFANPAVVVRYPSAFAADYAPGGAATWQGYSTAPWPTLAFDLGGHGAGIADIDVLPGGPATPPAPPTAPGLNFLGWFTASTGGTAFDFAAPRFTDSTAFAQWEPLAAPLAASAATLPPTGGDPTPLFAGGGLGLLLGGLTLFWASRRHAAVKQQ